MALSARVFRFRPHSFFALAAVLLSACSDTLSVRVETTVPDALVQSLPMSVSVYFEADFSGHKYVENSEDRRNWAIDTGSSQVAMFEQVLRSTFSEVTVLTSLPSAQAPAPGKLVFVPTIAEVQFGTPLETYFPFYEAWLRYKIKVQASDGALMDEIHLTAYGKSQKKRFGMVSNGISRAVELALRDAGAKLSTGLPSNRAVLQALAVPP